MKIPVSNFIMSVNWQNKERGVTLVELMVAIALGLLLTAGMAYLISGMSFSRNEIEKFNQQIESGRYALQVMSEDLRLAGYYGAKSFSCKEIYGNDACGMPAQMGSMIFRAGGAVPTALPNPCETTVSQWVKSASLAPDYTNYTSNDLLWAVQGYNNVTAAVSGCAALTAANVKSGTDVIVVRRQSTESIAAGAAVSGQPYIQVGSLPGDGDRQITFRLASGSSTSFNLQMKQQGLATYATTGINRMLVHVYFIAPCSRPVNGSTCATSGEDGIPTLKRLELGPSGFQTITIAEGIEDMNIEYGVDADRDGSSDGSFLEIPTTATAWWNVTSVRVNLLARNNEITPGYQEAKTFDLGAGRSPITFTGANAQFKRHVYSELVRINNISMRRE